jgi:hypothetical protein
MTRHRQQPLKRKTYPRIGFARQEIAPLVIKLLLHEQQPQLIHPVFYLNGVSKDGN